MKAHTGNYSLGPDDAALTVRTGRTGAAAKAGHNLEIRVGAWSARLELSDDPSRTSLTLEADARSLKVVTGWGGPKPLNDADKVKIERTIDDRILHGHDIAFRSSTVHDDGDGSLRVDGDLSLHGRSAPAQFTLTIGDDGRLTGEATVLQSAFGIEPYSAMMGALKLTDAVTISVTGRLSQP